eukprot:TRINITY_DN3331_c0_g1_i1.p1 TRINITY_DN3331_c0_g1~~TRINITY_DN3331_c0_g1_i1.p1  ORF type:complete len:1246 (+),score=230.31 TRINITY_DN3331_c0_g1_i1:1575-5312(+)
MATAARAATMAERRTGGDTKAAALSVLLADPDVHLLSDEHLVDAVVRRLEEQNSRARPPPKSWEECLPLLPVEYDLRDGAALRLLAEGRFGLKLKPEVAVPTDSLAVAADALARCWRAWVDAAGGAGGRAQLTCDLVNAMGCITQEDDWPFFDTVYCPRLASGRTAKPLSFEEAVAVIAAADWQRSLCRDQSAKAPTAGVILDMVDREAPGLTAEAATALAAAAVSGAEGMVNLRVPVIRGVVTPRRDSAADRAFAEDGGALFSTLLRATVWLRSLAGRRETAVVRLGCLQSSAGATGGVSVMDAFEAAVQSLPGLAPSPDAPLCPEAVAEALAALAGCRSVRLSTAEEVASFGHRGADACGAFADALSALNASKRKGEQPHEALDSASTRTALCSLLGPGGLSTELRGWARLRTGLVPTLMARCARPWPRDQPASDIDLPGLVVLWAELSRAEQQWQEASGGITTPVEESRPGVLPNSGIKRWMAVIGLWQPEYGETHEPLCTAVHQVLICGEAQVAFPDFACRTLVNEPLLAACRYAVRVFAPKPGATISDLEAAAGLQEAGLLRGSRRWAAYYLRFVKQRESDRAVESPAAGDRRWTRDDFLGAVQWLLRLRGHAARRPGPAKEGMAPRQLGLVPRAPWNFTPVQQTPEDAMQDSGNLCMVHDVDPAPQFTRLPPRCMDGCLQMLWQCACVGDARDILKTVPVERGEAAAAPPPPSPPPSIAALLRAHPVVLHFASAEQEPAHWSTQILNDFWSRAVAHRRQGWQPYPCDLAFLLSQACHTTYLTDVVQQSSSGESHESGATVPATTVAPAPPRSAGRTAPRIQTAAAAFRIAEAAFLARDERVYDPSSGTLRWSGELSEEAFWNAAAEAVPQLPRGYLRGQGVQWLTAAINAHQDIAFHHYGPADVPQVCSTGGVTAAACPVRRWTLTLLRKLVWRLLWLCEIYVKSLASDLSLDTTRPRLCAALEEHLPGLAACDSNRRHDAVLRVLAHHEREAALDFSLWARLCGWFDLARVAFCSRDASGQGALNESQLRRHLECPLLAAEAAFLFGLHSGKGRPRPQGQTHAVVDGPEGSPLSPTRSEGRSSPRSGWQTLHVTTKLATLGGKGALKKMLLKATPPPESPAQTEQPLALQLDRMESSIMQPQQQPRAPHRFVSVDALPAVPGGPGGTFGGGCRLDYCGFLVLMCAAEEHGGLRPALAQMRQQAQQVAAAVAAAAASGELPGRQTTTPPTESRQVTLLL